MMQALAGLSLTMVAVLSGVSWLLFSSPEAGLGPEVFPPSAEPSSSLLSPTVTVASSPSWPDAAVCSLPSSTLVSTSVRERVLSDADLPALQSGRWFVLVYADWCPHSRAYRQIWRDVLTKIAQTPEASLATILPIFATASFSVSYGLASALLVQKLPSFLLIQDGHLRGHTIVSPSPEELYAFATADWTPFARDPRRIPHKIPQAGALNMRLFDWLGLLTFGLQEVVINWILNDKLLAYGSMLAILLGVLLFRRHCTLL